MNFSDQQHRGSDRKLSSLEESRVQCQQDAPYPRDYMDYNLNIGTNPCYIIFCHGARSKERRFCWERRSVESHWAPVLSSSRAYRQHGPVTCLLL
jgi:hypothetical protein